MVVLCRQVNDKVEPKVSLSYSIHSTCVYCLPEFSTSWPNFCYSISLADLASFWKVKSILVSGGQKLPCCFASSRFGYFCLEQTRCVRLMDLRKILGYCPACGQMPLRNVTMSTFLRAMAGKSEHHGESKCLPSFLLASSLDIARLLLKVDLRTPQSLHLLPAEQL